MRSFLHQVTSDLWDKHGSFENVTMIVPSKRAGTFIRDGIPEITKKTVFAPEIYSIESFVELIANLSLSSQTILLFELYEAHLSVSKDASESFATFSRWSTSILQDFNEIDRYLVPAKDLFESLGFIKEIELWSLESNSVNLVQDYLEFWKGLFKLYEVFNANLKKKGLGHQGLLYREAIAQLDGFLQQNDTTNFIFVGFNALNKAEEKLINAFLATGNADIYWDLDNSFLEDPIHDAGYFIRHHFENWKFYQENTPQGISHHFNTPKNIQIIGVPKKVAEAKLVGSLVEELSNSSPNNLSSTAIVLGDESLLNPLLNSLPSTPEKVNITMGYPLNKTSLTGLFHSLFELYISLDPKGWYHRNLLGVLSHPAIQDGLVLDSGNPSTDVINSIKKENAIYINPQRLVKLMSDASPIVKLVFSGSNRSPKDFIRMLLDLINILKAGFEQRNNNLELEYLFKYHEIFKELEVLLFEYPYINDLKSLHSLFKELISSESVDFLGEPLDGLQIMGMLESRNLDFETVIITTVNEGFLPSGKTNTSFIPFDLKRRFGLPTYKEKDAVYTYHFYRLLQRAKNIHLLYNTEADVVKGGEKSRFIPQLIMDEFHGNNVSQELRMPEIITSTKPELLIEKDANVIDAISLYFAKGLSPSSLSNYIKNPIQFYKEKILGIKETAEIEETIAFNTLGTVIHNVLEKIYAPFIDKNIEIELLLLQLKEVKSLVHIELLKFFKVDAIKSGKNLIASRIIEKYIKRFIRSEIADLRHNTIKILALEEELSYTFKINGNQQEIKLKGIIDRVDERNGVKRILDYKTGKVSPAEVEITSWEDLRTKVERAKALQVLCYSLLYMRNYPKTESLQTGIIPIKQKALQPLLFCQKPSARSRDKNHTVTETTLSDFEIQLKEIIKEIADPSIPFVNLEN